MENDLMAGGRASLAWAQDRDDECARMLERLLGEKAAARAFEDESLLPLLLPVIHSDGTDRAAVASLRRACGLDARVTSEAA